MSYEYHESYKHKLAKELIYSWLLNCENETGFCPKLPFGWRTGNYGVFMELPFYQTSHPYYFECSGGIKKDGTGWLPEITKSDIDHQRYFDSQFDRGKILFVPDICIFHKGEVKILIEVVHKSPLTEHKIKTILNFFGGTGTLELWEIEAENILSQTNLKCELEFFKVLDTWSWYSEAKKQFSYSSYLADKRNAHDVLSLIQHGRKA